MTEQNLVSLLSHPLAQLVVTAAVASVTAVITVRLMGAMAPVAARRTVAAAPASTGPARAAAGQDDPALIAAITAAVYATIGAHRVVYIGAAASASGSSWTTEMRTQHHTSHALSRPRPSND